MFPILLILALLGTPATTSSMSNPRKKDTHCPKKVVQNKPNLHQLRYNATVHKFFNQDVSHYIKLDPNLQAIVGGSRAFRIQYPWVALILLQDVNWKVLKRCTGVALSSRVMMTVAHCTPRDYKESMTVLLGFTNLSKAGQQSRSVTFVYKDEIHTTRFFDKDGRPSQDIAIFPYNLHRPTDKSKPNWRPNKLPTVNIHSGILGYDKNCTVLGFGLVNLEKNTSATFLQKAPVYIVDDNSPVIRFATNDPGGPCIGDDGGPLLCQVGHRMTLVGLVVGNVHFSGKKLHNCDYHDRRDSVGTAVKMATHFMWIHTIFHRIDKDSTLNV